MGEPDSLNIRKITWALILFSVQIISSTVLATDHFTYPPSCLATHIDETASIDYVVDGDTLKLTDGRTVRVIGVNTPEMNKRTGEPEPYAALATQATRDFFGKQKAVLLQYGQMRYDRHERLLAYVYRPDKQSLALNLIANGYGFHITIPPNVEHLDCLANAQTQAKREKIKIWSHPYFAYKKVNHDAKSLKSGFQLLQGNIVKVKKTKSNWWLELDGPVVIKISQRNARYFPNPDLKTLKNQLIKVKGWLVKRQSKAKNPRSKPWIMTVQHPSAIEF